jgi:hypothetical protein
MLCNEYARKNWLEERKGILAAIFLNDPRYII